MFFLLKIRIEFSKSHLLPLLSSVQILIYIYLNKVIYFFHVVKFLKMLFYVCVRSCTHMYLFIVSFPYINFYKFQSEILLLVSSCCTHSGHWNHREIVSYTHTCDLQTIYWLNCITDWIVIWMRSCWKLQFVSIFALI